MRPTDSVLAAYAAAFATVHPDARVEPPDDAELIGRYPGGEVWRVEDGWGEYYFADPAAGEASYVCSKMPDVAACDVADGFKGKIDSKELGMGDAAWDAAVVSALGGEKMATEKTWTAKRIAELPDSSFAYVEPGGVKDATGLTAPRSLRHLAYRDEAGAVDVPRLREAIQAVDRAALPRLTKDRVRARLEKVLKQAEPDERRSVAEENPGGWPLFGDETWKSWSDEAKAAACRPKKDGAEPGSLEEQYEEFKQKVIDAVKAAAGPGSRVQALLFDAAQFREASEAAAWANDHSFESGGVVEKGGQFVVPQRDAGELTHLREVELTAGVRARVGYEKSAAEAVGRAFLGSAGDLGEDQVAGAECEPVHESAGEVVWRVKCAGRDAYYSQSGGDVAPVPEAVAKAARAVEGAPFALVFKAEEQRYTLSVVYPCSKRGAPEPDFHGDVMSAEELEKSAWAFMSKGVERIGLMHRPGTAGAGRVVESYIWRGPEWKMDKDAGGTPQVVRPGDWVMGIVWEPSAWDAIKSGEIKGVSLQGAARKEAFS